LVIKVQLPYSNKFKLFEDIKCYIVSDDYFEGNVLKSDVISFLENDYYDELVTKRIIADRYDGSRLVIDYNTRAWIV